MAIKRTKWDVVFSDYIRYRDNWTCQRCHKKYVPPTNALHCSHFFSRGKWSVRFDEENCEALCYGCHSHLGGNPIEHMMHKQFMLGSKQLEVLRRKANKALKSGEKKYFLSKEFRAKIKEKIKSLEE